MSDHDAADFVFPDATLINVTRVRFEDDQGNVLYDGPPLPAPPEGSVAFRLTWGPAGIQALFDDPTIPTVDGSGFTRGGV